MTFTAHSLKLTLQGSNRLGEDTAILICFGTFSIDQTRKSCNYWNSFSSLVKTQAFNLKSHL